MMALALAVAVAFVLLILAVPCITLAVQVLGRWLSPTEEAPTQGHPSKHDRASLAVLIPAHDEEAGIARTIQSVRPQLGPNDRMVVVADNCNDQTAAMARALGAEVIERTHQTLRGKGHALDFGVRHLALNPPDQVLMLDADCKLWPGSLDTLRQACTTQQGPVQACDLMQAQPDSALTTKVAAFAWLVKNKVRPMGGARWGWPCQLMGTGMIFPWSVISTAPLASGHLAEDMQLGAHLALSGHMPVYCGNALVTSAFPDSKEAIASQRKRWEHGHLSMILELGLPLLGQAVVRRDWRLLGMALDMCVPPLSSLVMLALTSVFACLVMWAFGMAGSGLLTGWAGLNLALLCWAVTLSWRLEGRHVLTLKELSSVPMYMLSKLSIYASFISRRQTQWIRTKREEGES